MEATQIYAIAAGSVFIILTIINALLSIMQKLHACNMIILKHFFYPFFIRRHRFIGPWTRVDALWRVLYLTINILFVVFPLLPMTKTAKRAGHISLINMIPLFLGPHLSFLADILGLQLHSYQLLHGVSAAMTFTLGIVHVILGLLHEPVYRRFTERPQVAGLIVRKYLYVKHDTDST